LAVREEKFLFGEGVVTVRWLMRGIAKYHKCVVFTHPVGAIHESPVWKYSNISNTPINNNLPLVSKFIN